MFFRIDKDPGLNYIVLFFFNSIPMPVSKRAKSRVARKSRISSLSSELPPAVPTVIQKVDEAIKDFEVASQEHDEVVVKIADAIHRLGQVSKKFFNKRQKLLKQRKASEATTNSILLFNVALTSLTALSFGLSIVASATLFTGILITTLVCHKVYELAHKTTVDVVNKLRAAQEKRFFEKHPRHDNPTLDVPQTTFDAFMNGHESHTSYYAYAKSFFHEAKSHEDFLPAWSAGFRCAQGEDESLMKMIQPTSTQAKSSQLR